jgi:hypothetical protein
VKLDITDFSGGILEAVSPGDFTERQNAVVKGFVLEDEVRLRTQGAIQSISALTDVVACRTFRGASQSYILVLRTGGVLQYAVSPSRTATNATTSALTFTNLTTIGAEARFTGDARAKVSNEYKPATIVHSLAGVGNGVLVYENDAGNALLIQSFADFYPQITKEVALVQVTNGGSGYTSIPTVSFTGGSGSGATATATVLSGAVVGVTVTEGGLGYTTAPSVVFTGGGGSGAVGASVLQETSNSAGGVLPRHNVACMWGDTLLLGDIEWSDANAISGLNAGNVKRYPNYVWHAQDPTNLTVFDPRYPARIAEEGSIVVGLQQTIEGVLVLTTTTTGQAGLTMLRGTPDNYEVETMRPGLGALPGIDSSMRSPIHCWWNEVASTMFVDSLGKIYQVRGSQADRIDRFGVQAPEIGSTSDSVAAIGQWLFASRAGRFLVMRSFGSDGAWTELVKPAGTPTSFSVDRDLLNFVSDNKLYRYCVEGPTAERGMVSGAYVDLEFGTRTLGVPEEKLDKWWTQATIRLQSITGGVLKTVQLFDSGVLATSPGSALFTLNKNLTERDLTTVPGLGPSIECSAKFVLTGDVRIENVSLEVEAGDEER